MVIFVLLLPKYSLQGRWSFNYRYVLNLLDSTSKFTSNRKTNGATVPITPFYRLFLVASTHVSNQSTHTDLLLIYVYGNVHQYVFGNLKYVIETAVRENDGADYIFILQQVGNKSIDENQMPRLPKSNAFYIQHENKCFDYGTIGWFLEQYTTGNPWQGGTSVPHGNAHNRSNRIFDLRRYKYFIFMNSSIRGPFFPSYMLKFLSDHQTTFRKAFHWYYMFTKRLNDQVKLVGVPMNCMPLPHIQSYLLTVDFTGLSLLLKDATTNTGVFPTGVFGCYASKGDTVMFSELGISTVLLNAGYTTNSMMSKYQSIGFSTRNNDTCPHYANPNTDYSTDGVSMEPYDVIFIKFNGVYRTTEGQKRAAVYQRWMEQAKTNHLSSP